MPAPSTLAQRVHDFVLEGHSGKPAADRKAFGSAPEWRRLADLGTRLWLDTGDVDEAAALWTAEFSGLTTNNTLLNREIQKGIYDDLVSQAAALLRSVEPNPDGDTLRLEIAFILNARHGLRLAEQFGANVSVELHTDLADDAERAVAYGLRYYALCPEFFYVKVPFTPAGLLATRRLSSLGVPVNFTLGFSARQNYLAALLARPAFVNVFLGRLNAFVADHQLGAGINVGEKAALATQRMIRDLREAGLTTSQLIAASLRDGAQVGALAGVDVMTLPPKVAAQHRAAPATSVFPRTNDDPDVPLAEGFTLAAFNGPSLWEVPDVFRMAVQQLLRRDLNALTPSDLQEHFAGAGFAGFMPRWTDEELQAIAKEGKIPSYPHWRERLARGTVGLDALMNQSALAAFTTDQAALDQRIASIAHIPAT